MNVLKFGGTSMGDEHTWRQVLDIIRLYEQPVIVVSATARTTRQLIAVAEMAKKDLDQALTLSQSIKERHQKLVENFLTNTNHPKREEIKQACTEWICKCINKLEQKIKKIATQESLSLQTKDFIASIGEQLSAYLFAQCGQAYGLQTCWVDARKIIKTDADFGQANPNLQTIDETVYLLRQNHEEGYIPIMGGFYGETGNGEITTLGFEGSDYSASLIGAALQAETIEIWTDVSGIYTCDPHVVEHARPIPELSFQEATELAYFGAKVLHPSTMKPAAGAHIPVFVKNIFEPDHPGTKIHDGQLTGSWAKAITYLKDVTILTVTSNGALKGHQFLAAFFEELHNNHIAVNAVTTTEASVSVALQTRVKDQALYRKFKKIGTVTEDKGQSLVSLVGCTFVAGKDIRETVFAAIAEDSPSLISYSKTKQNLNIALPKTELIPAVCRIHDAVFTKQ